MTGLVSPVAVYRFFDSAGQLLYVGMTGSPAQRWREHAASKPWWQSVASAKVEWFTSHEEAAQTEKAAIRAEMPVHNVVGALTSIEKARIHAAHHAGDALRDIASLAPLEYAAFEAHADVEEMLNAAIARAVDAGANAVEIEAAHAPIEMVNSSIEEMCRKRDREAAKAAKAERARLREERAAAKRSH